MARADGSTLIVEFAPGDDPLTPLASCTFESLTDRVKEPLSSMRGSGSELQPVSPGMFTVICRNWDRALDPAFEDGPWFGSLTPMRRIRVLMTIGATTAAIATGYVLSYEQGYDGLDQIATLRCVDAFRVLEQSSLAGSAFACEVLADAPEVYYPAQSLNDLRQSEPLIGTVALSDFFGDSHEYGVTTTTQPVGEALALGNFAGLALGGISVAPKAAEAWFSNVNETAAELFAARASTSTTTWIRVGVRTSTGLSVLYGYSNAADNRSVATTIADFPLDVSKPVHVAAAVDSSNMYVWVNGALAFTTALSVGTSTVSSYAPDQQGGVLVDSAAGTGTLDAADWVGVSHAAFYATPPTSTRWLDHYHAGVYGYGHPYGERAGARIGRILDSIGWPTADRDLSQGETVLGPWLPNGRSALADMRQVESTEQGLLFVAKDGKITFRDRQWFMTNARNVTAQATFGESGNELRYKATNLAGNDADWVRNIVTVDYASGTVTVKDQASIDAYTQQSDGVSAPLLTSGWLARQLARARLRLRKDPATRIPRISINPRSGSGPAVMLPAVCALELGDRVLVKRRPKHGGGDPILQNCTVRGIAHNPTRSTWPIDLSLAPAPPNYTEGPYLTLGDATYGVIGASAGNVVPY